MAQGVRERRRLTAKHLDARATTTTSASPTQALQQPTKAIALTTAFKPPQSCFDNKLSMLPPDKEYMIWVNEPVPVDNRTVDACYPSQFMDHYTSVPFEKVGSSIVPAMSPLECPQNHCTASATDLYIACCPSGYQLHTMDTPVDPDRPFYGGTCYSDLPAGTSIFVIQYQDNGETGSGVFFTSASGAQAYAHPIDGFASTLPTQVGCVASSSSLFSKSDTLLVDTSSVPRQTTTAAASSSAAAVAASTPNRISNAAIAGAAVGGVVGLAALVGFIWFILAYYRKHRKTPPPPPPKVHHIGDDYANGKKDVVYYRHEADSGPASHEIGSSEWGEDNSGARVSRMNDGHGAFEMPGELPPELDGGVYAKGDKKIGADVDKKKSTSQIPSSKGWRG